MSERMRYTVLDVKYGIKRGTWGTEAEWLIHLAPVGGPTDERYLLRMAGPFPLRLPPYARGTEVDLDKRWLNPLEKDEDGA